MPQTHPSGADGKHLNLKLETFIAEIEKEPPLPKGA
jgi:hypothetical protein